MDKLCFDAAREAFTDAFTRGYIEGKRLLTQDITRPSVEFPFEIDVPRSAVIDDQWRQYVPQFQQAGLQAAMSLQRKGDAQLDATEACDSSVMACFEDTYRWYVVDRVS